MKILFALNQPTAIADMEAIHHALPFAKVTPCNGVYKGDSERSYLMEGNKETLGKVLALAKEHSQESILIVNNSNKAALLYCEAMEAVTLPGIWQEIAPDLAECLDAYTTINSKIYAVI